MTDYIAGKTIIITGAAGGFGRQTARKAGERGARVLCVDINGEAALALAQDIQNGGGEALGVAADVAQVEDMRAAAKKAVDAWGVIDVMVNNAGIMPLAFIADHGHALESWNRCIDINFKGMMNGTVAVHDQMLAQGHGHIINMSSIYGNHPVVGAAVYGATKAAVNYFSHAVRQESRGKIKVTVIKPTGVPSTGLAETVVNRAGGAGIVGHNGAAFIELYRQTLDGSLPPSMNDPENIDYFALHAEEVATAIIHAIDQPLGVTLSDVTVRATGDFYIL